MLLAAGCGGSGSGLDRFVDLGLPLYCGGGKGHYVALTFDDGPGVDTEHILALLRRDRAQATFFDVGKAARRRPWLVRQSLQAGAVGEHTWSHPDLTLLSAAGVARQVRRGRDAVAAAAGQPIRLFRPSFGAHGGVIDRAARRLKLVEVLWSVDSGDASGFSTPGPQKIYENVASRVAPGSIVLMHENITGDPDLIALRRILPDLRRRGFDPVSVPELLAKDPPSRAQIENGIAGCA